MSLLKELKAIEDQTFMLAFFALLLLISPGIMGIMIFRPDLIIQLDAFKLLILSLALTAPLTILNTIGLDIALGMNDDRKELFSRFCFSTILTGLELYIAILIAYLSHFSMHQSYILLGIVECIILVSIWKQGRQKRKEGTV